MESKGKYYLTTAIAYTSGKPHIGNNYEIVLADSIARFKRKEGYDVFFQTGTDEHGQKIELKAQEAGVAPKDFVDNVAGIIRGMCDMLNVSYDKFIRTTDDYHERQVQKIFKRLYEQGDIYKGAYEGMYCTPCESFWTESQLVDGKCPDCGREVKPAREEAYFFRMSKYADRLIRHINEHPEFIQPVSRKNEMMNNFLLPGLQDLCVSRTSFTWGVPVDFDDKHVVYVWLDALTNYITGIGYDAEGNSTDQYKKLWPADLHLIGKDIIRFHTIYWPIFLMALEEPLPKQIFGHPWLMMNGGKMSKSKGNVIYVDDLVDFFGVDAVRYYMVHEMPFENDGNATWELIAERTNSDLANTLGNLVNRTISMSNKYFGGVVSRKGEAATEQERAVDEDLRLTALGTLSKAAAKMEELRVADALTEVFALFKRCNKYIDETEPWVLAKNPEKAGRLSTVLYNLVESIVMGASLLEPFMPETAGRIAAQLNTSLRGFDRLGTFGLYPDGQKVTEKPEILFARLDMKEVEKQEEKILAAMTAASDVSGQDEAGGSGKEGNGGEKVRPGSQGAQSAQAGEKPVSADREQNGQKPVSSDRGQAGGAGTEAGIDIEPKAEITYDDFAKLQFQVGEILSCEAVPKSKKLLCSQVKIGSQVKQIVSGIKAYYTPEEMVGKKVMVLVNLKPAKLAGVVSEGMLLCAEDAEGRLALVKPEKEMPSGAEIA